MHKGFGALWLLVSLAAVGCSGSDAASSAPLELGGSGGSTAGHSGAGIAGVPGSAGGFATAGTTAHGGTGGSGAGPGSASNGGSAGAGNTSSGGRGGGGGGVSVAGTSSAGAAGGSSAVAGSGGKTGSGGSGGSGPAPTFTMIYDTIITTSCGGTQCHLKRPTPQDYDFSSKSAASAAWRSDVIPGDGADSPIFQVLNFGIMPKGQPSLSVEQLTLVLDWIDAGALDN